MTQPVDQSPANAVSIALARMVASIGGASIVQPPAVDDQPPLDAVTIDAKTGDVSATIMLADGSTYDVTVSPSVAPAPPPAQEPIA